jgi:hypothetical protein
MSGVRDVLEQQGRQWSAKVDILAKTVEERYQSWIASVQEFEAAKKELESTKHLLEALDKALAKAAKPTIMRAILDVLKHRPDGMTALEILAELNARYFEGKLLRTSLSPQLSRLKDRDRKIDLRGDRWFIAPEQPSLFKRRI